MSIYRYFTYLLQEENSIFPVIIRIMVTHEEVFHNFFSSFMSYLSIL